MASDQSDDEAQNVSASEESDDGTQTESNSLERECKTNGLKSNVGVATTPRMLIKAKEQLKEIILHMPDDKKAVYGEALVKIPHIMATESDPLSFLRVESFDLIATAHRLTLYWDARKTIFGTDRAFRPVKTLSSDTALTVSAQELLRRGALLELPKDRMGRTVLYFDTEKLNQKVSDNDVHISQALSEALFYMLDAVGARNSKTQSEGLVFVIALSDLAVFHDQITSVKQLLKVAREALPIKIHALHLCRVMVSVEKKEHEIVENIATEFKSCLEVDKGSCLVELHHQTSSQSIRNQLERFGLLEMFLPRYVGGTGEPSTVGLRGPGVAHGADPSSSLCRASVVSEEDAARLEERRKRKRKSDALYARRKRMREKQQEKELQEKCLELSKANMQLDRESRQLEEMLQKAQAQLRASENCSNNHLASAPLHSQLSVAPRALSDQTSQSPSRPLIATQLFSTLQENNSTLPSQSTSNPTPFDKLCDTLQMLRNGTACQGIPTGYSFNGSNHLGGNHDSAMPPANLMQNLIAASAGAAGQTPQALYLRAKELIKKEHHNELPDKSITDTSSIIDSSHVLQGQLLQLLNCVHGLRQNVPQDLQLNTNTHGAQFHMPQQTVTDAAPSHQGLNLSDVSGDPQMSVVLQALIQTFLTGLPASANQQKTLPVPQLRLHQETFHGLLPAIQGIFPQVQQPLKPAPPASLSDIQRLLPGSHQALPSSANPYHARALSDDSCSRNFLLNALGLSSTSNRTDSLNPYAILRGDSSAQSAASTSDVSSLLQAILDSQVHHAKNSDVSTTTNEFSSSSKLLETLKACLGMETAQHQSHQQLAPSSVSMGLLMGLASTAEQTSQQVDIAAALKSLLAPQENRTM